MDKQKLHFKLKQILRFSFVFVLMFAFFYTGKAQLDTKHYIPPVFGREDLAEGGSGEGIYLLISTPQVAAIDVYVTDGAGNPMFATPFSVSKASPVSVRLSTAIGATKGRGTKFLIDASELATVLSDEGMILTANKAFFVSVRVDETAQAASLTSKGTAGFGQEFRTGHIWNEIADGYRKANMFSFMATEDNTHVKVSDFGSVDFENVSEVGGEINVTLNAGESYVLAAYVDGAAANLNDVNGTRITSDKDIVVNSGTWLGGSPGGGGVGRDIGIDQIASVESTGFEYILVKGEGTTNENVIVVASIDGTEVSLNGAAPSVFLNAGEYHRFTSTDYSVNENMYISTNQPTYVYQGLNGATNAAAGNNERQLGLNFMPPILCLGGTNVDINDIDQLGNAVIQIIGETGQTVTVNGTDVSASAKAVTGNPNYVTYKVTGYTGNVTVASPRPIRVSLTVESGNVGMAGFFSGFTTAPVIETPNGYNSSTCIPDNLPVVLEAQGFDSYEWYLDGVLLPGETAATISVDSPGEYTASGTISGCVSSEQSYPLGIVLCPGDVGAAKNVVSTTEVSPDIFDIVYDLIVTNFSTTNPATNIQVTDDITDGLPSGATANIQVAPVIQSGSFTSGGVSATYDGDTDIAILQTSASTVDTELAVSSTITIRYTVRVDMTSTTSPSYTNQAIVTNALAGPNDGVTGPFDNQDFSDEGTDPDPNGNGDPTEAGENDPTEVCLSSTSISYDNAKYSILGVDPTPTITGLNGGDFSSTFGLTINSTTGEIDLSNCIVGNYVVTYSFGGLCPTTTNVEIVINETDLNIVKTVDNSTPDVGSNVVFTLTVNNQGPIDATNVVVNDLLPSGYTYVSDDGGGNYVSGTGVWTIGNIANAGTAVLNITATVNASGSYANTASVSGDQADPDNTDDSSTNTPSPVWHSDLNIVKTVDNSSPNVGENVTFTLTVTNQGPNDATNVVVNDLLPSGYTYVSDNGGGAYVSATGVWTVGNIVNGANVALDITATVNPSGVYANTASVSGNENDDDPTDDSDTNTPTVNNLPIAVDDVANVDEDGTLNGTAVISNDTGLGDGGIVVSLDSDVSNGTLTLNPDGTYTYVPDADFNGTDSFTYQVCDTNGDCDIATVVITVNPVNDVVVAVDDVANVDEYGTLNGTAVTSNDTGLGDGGIVVSLDSDVSNGTLILNPDGTYTYVPDADFNGTDSFTYQVCDANGDCDIATVVITVNSVNDQPIAEDDDIEINEDSGANNIMVLEDNGNGEDNFGGDGSGTGTISLIVSPENGTLTLNDNGTPDDPTDDYFVYTPEDDFYGSDSFEYEICDADGDCDQAVVSIEVIDDNVLDIPEGFSPNGDGINDNFVIEGLESYPANTIVIFNRWGNKVYEASPYNNDWDGTNMFGITIGGNQLPEGTYFYIIKLKDDMKVIKGYIYITK